MILRVDIGERDIDDLLRRRLEALKKQNGHGRRALLSLLNVLSTEDGTLAITIDKP